jgi:hypothetical protein
MHRGFFDGIKARIDETKERLGLVADNCKFHLTGGNKLMALAAFDWCRSAGSSCFYIEKEQQVIEFTPEGGDLRQKPSRSLNLDLAKDVDPLQMVRCQLDAAEVEEGGQLLTLSADGERLPGQQIQALLENDRTDLGHLRKLLNVVGAAPKDRAGDRLELATAVAILKAGVPMVRRGIRTKSSQQTAAGRDESEQDLVFNWKGRLWIVDCKDRNSPEQRVDKLRSELMRTGVSDKARQLLDDLEQELRDKELKTLKEDMNAVAEAGGIKGKIIIVRREDLPGQAKDFARVRKMDVVLRGRLFQQINKCLSD